MGIRAVLPNRDADQRLKLRWARGRPNFLVASQDFGDTPAEALLARSRS